MKMTLCFSYFMKLFSFVKSSLFLSKCYNSGITLNNSNIATIQDVKNALSKLTGAAYPGKQNFIEHGTNKASSGLPVQLPTKRKMSDSYCEATLSLRDNIHLLDLYANFRGSVRYGRLLEDLDVLGVLISYMHVWNSNWTVAPMSIVTASVDNITMHNRGAPLDPLLDLRYSGHVTWVGSSSIEVTMHVDQQQSPSSKSWLPVLTGKFVNAARNPLQSSSFLVNGLLVESNTEKQLFAEGQTAKERRLEQCRTSVLNMQPTSSEINYIHSLFLETIDSKSSTFHRRNLPSNSVWFQESMVKTAHLCQPQQRNVYNKIFGGFLMRKAFELAFIVVYNFSRSDETLPHLVNIEDISFRAPVEIGDCLYLSSQVVCVSDRLAQVRVHAEVLKPVTGDRKTTNDFHFTFECCSSLPRVIPKTYSEAMLLVDGQRRLSSYLDSL